MNDFEKREYWLHQEQNALKALEVARHNLANIVVRQFVLPTVTEIPRPEVDTSCDNFASVTRLEEHPKWKGNHTPQPPTAA